MGATGTKEIRLMNLHAKEVVRTSCAGRVRTGVVRHLLMLIAALMVYPGAAVSTSDGNLNETSENKTSQEDRLPKLTIPEELEQSQKLPELKDILLVLWYNSTRQIEGLEDNPLVELIEEMRKDHRDYLQNSYQLREQVFWYQMTSMDTSANHFITSFIVFKNLRNVLVPVTLVRTQMCLYCLVQLSHDMIWLFIITKITLTLQYIIRGLLVTERLLTQSEAIYVSGTIILCLHMQALLVSLWYREPRPRRGLPRLQEFGI